jgi:hypothetical protein
MSRLVKQPILILSIALISFISCSKQDTAGSKHITPEYDTRTGRLQTLKYDSNGDGKVDMTSTMDGSRVLKIEIDQDFDGVPDRWEYYDSSQRLEKVGFSRARDGKEDAWSFADASGNIEKIEISTRRDGRIQRVEYYEGGVLARADEDTDGDGKLDKWETYDGSRLATVAFDTLRRGAADRRMIYRPDGSARMEFDPKGDGAWAPR